MLKFSTQNVHSPRKLHAIPDCSKNTHKRLSADVVLLLKTSVSGHKQEHGGFPKHNHGVSVGPQIDGVPASFFPSFLSILASRFSKAGYLRSGLGLLFALVLKEGF